MSAKTELRVNLTGVDKTAAAFRSIGQNIKRVAGLAAGAFAVGKIVSGAKDVVDELVDLDKQALKVGMDAVVFEDLGHAFEGVGLSADDLVKMIQKMNVSIGKDSGLKDISLDAKELKNMKPEEAFVAIGEAISNIGKESDRAVKLKEIFGKGAQGLMPLMRSGPEEFKTALSAMGEMYTGFSSKMISQAWQIKDAFSAVAKDITVTLANAFGGNIENIEDIGVVIYSTFQNAKVSLFEFWETMKTIFSGLISFVKSIYDTIAKLFEKIGSMLPEMSLDFGLSDETKDKIKKVADEAADKIEKFKAGIEVKKKMRTVFDNVGESAEKALGTIKDLKSNMSLAGSYELIKAQFGDRGRRQLPAMAGGGQGWEQANDYLKAIAENTENTSDHTENIEGEV